jgi:hypothetical protein
MPVQFISVSSRFRLCAFSARGSADASPLPRAQVTEPWAPATRWVAQEAKCSPLAWKRKKRPWSLTMYAELLMRFTDIFLRRIRNEGFIRCMIYLVCDTVQVLRQIKAENDPQGMVLQQVVVGGTTSAEADGASSSSSKGSQRIKDKEQRHRLAKINSSGDNADFLRRNLTMLKISSYVLFGAHISKIFVFGLGICCLSDCCASTVILNSNRFVSLCEQRICTLSSPTKYFSAIKRRRCCPSRIKSTGPRTAPCRCV